VDPFPPARDALAQDMQDINTQFAGWKELLNAGNTSSPDSKFMEVDRALRANIREREEDCAILGKAISKMEKHREKYVHVNDRELANRKKFVADIRNMLEKMRLEADSPAVAGKIQKDKMELLTGGNDAAKVREEKRVHERATRIKEAMNEEKEHQVSGLEAEVMVVVRDQDKVSEDMLSAVTRLKGYAENIGDELDKQDVMLTDLSENLNEAQGRLDVVQKKLERWMGTKTRWMFWAILISLLVLIILIFVLINS